MLAELVMQGGPEGIELAASVARSDPSVDVQFGVVEALADFAAPIGRHPNCLPSPSQNWAMLAAKGYEDEITDRDARDRVNRERQRLLESETSPAGRIRLALASANPSEADKRSLAAAIEAAAFPPTDQNISWQVQKAFERYPDLVAGALLRRLEAGRDLPYRASDMLASAGAVDDGPISAAVTDLAVPEHERPLP